MTTDTSSDREPRPSGLARGLVWALVLAEMRAEARAAGDDRFDRPYRSRRTAGAPRLQAVPGAGARGAPTARPADERRDGGRSAA